MLCDNLEDGVQGRFKRKGTHTCLWLTHVNVWQNQHNQSSSVAQSCPALCDPMDCSTPTQYCKTIIFQLKINFLKKIQGTQKDGEWKKKKKMENEVEPQLFSPVQIPSLAASLALPAVASSWMSSRTSHLTF